MSYPMQYVDGPQAVSQTYLESHLPEEFYRNKPSHVKGVFSTRDGQRPWRTPQEILPARYIHLWSKDEVQGVCNSIRHTWWAWMKEMPEPHSWDDLLLYFDAHDIYSYGALNLWNVIKTLNDENKSMRADYIKFVTAEVGNWADVWLENPDNRKKLRRWDENHESWINLMGADDWLSLGSIDHYDRGVLEKALKYRRDVIVHRIIASKPKDLISVYDDNLHNWLGK